jgi:hypothetical protein
LYYITSLTKKLICVCRCTSFGLQDSETRQKSLVGRRFITNVVSVLEEVVGVWRVVDWFVVDYLKRWGSWGQREIKLMIPVWNSRAGMLTKMMKMWEIRQ